MIKVKKEKFLIKSFITAIQKQWVITFQTVMVSAKYLGRTSKNCTYSDEDLNWQLCSKENLVFKLIVLTWLEIRNLVIIPYNDEIWLQKSFFKCTRHRARQTIRETLQKLVCLCLYTWVCWCVFVGWKLSL
jgi:hypothetical protein